MGADERSDGEARPGGGAGLSFGFKAKKPQAVKFAVQGAKKEEVREEILVLSSESFETTNPSQQTTKKDVPVIPKIENTFQVGVGRTDPRFRADRFLPPSGESARVADGEDRFVAAEKDEQTAAVKYGLQQKGRQGRVDGTERKPIDSREQEERQLLKQDMEQLPEEADEKAYDRMPIEDFGMAMLRGMGWSEGKPIGRNTKEAAAAIEYVKRPDRLGLGAQPDKLVGKDPTRPVKPGESRERKVMVAAPAENGAARSVKKLDEKLVEAEEPGARPGKTMRIRKGTHAGLWCVVLQLLEQEPGRSERARVRLQPSEQEVTVRCSELEEKGKIMDAEERREEKRKAKRRREEAAGDVATDTKRDAGPGSRERRPWLRAEIRVRVVSRGLERGRLYLRKAVVIDVVAPGVCDIRLDDDGRVVQGVAQADLETVVPKKEGGTVQVVRGRQGGQFGVLLGRNKQTQLVAVKLHGEDEVLKLHLNDIAEYTGVVSHLE